MITGLVLKAVVWVASSFFGKQLSQFAAGAITAAIVGGVVIGGSAWALHSAYSYGVDQTEAKWQAKALQSKLDAAKADLDAARLAEAAAKLRTAAVERAALEEQRGVAEYVEELKKRPSAACALTDDDLRGLRIGRNANPAKSRHAPKARWFKRTGS